MKDLIDLTPNRLKKWLGHKVEVIAFGLAYQGKLQRVDERNGTIKITDRRDSAILEIERIESFHCLDEKAH